MKTIICPNYLKNDLINKLLIENNTNHLLDTKIIPFNVYINYQNKYSNELLLLQAHKKLLAIKEELNLYKEMLQYPAFIQEIVDFTKELIMYNIDTLTLPENNIQQVELKQIINTIIDLPFNEKHYSTYKVKENIEDVFIVDYFTNNSYEYNVIKQLLSNGAKLIKLSDLSNIDKSVKFALNNREEIESVAQDICNKENALESILVCCDPENQIPVIRQVFARYNIPIQNLKYNINSKVANNFILITNFIIKKDYESMIDFISLLPLNKEAFSYIHTYINTPNEIEFISNEIDENLINIKYYINEILLIKNIKDVLIYSYNFLKNNLAIDNPLEINTLKKIRSIIESTYNEINTKEDIETILYTINNIEIKIDDSISDGVLVTKLNNPVFNKKYTYVIGCSSKNYPGFNGLKGIFDEKYVSSINYPTLKERNNEFFQQFKWIDNSSNNIIYSYHISDLSGKSIEGSFELEKYGKPSKWDILSIDSLIFPKHELSEETAGKLFFKDNSLHGSVSSFEQFFTCPYKYFISYGLNIKENREDKIDNITIGNIVHKTMESLIKKYGKDYTNAQIDNILSDLKVELLAKFPKDYLLINQLFKSIKDNIYTNFIYLNEMEIDTSFKPVHPEYKFSNFKINNGEVIIKGSIDRIDIAYDLLRIIDYKTGNATLEPKNVSIGTSLQLITYLIVAVNLLNKKPMGVFYNSFKTKITEYTGDKDIFTNKDSFVKANRLQGILFNEDTTSLSSDLTKYYSCKKPSRKKIPLHFEYNTIEEGFYTLYRKIYNELLNGFIDTVPVENGCNYCPYKPICRYKGKQENPDPIFYMIEGDSNEVE